MFTNSIPLHAIVVVVLAACVLSLSIEESNLLTRNLTSATDGNPDPNELLATLYTDRYCPEKDWNPIYRYDYQENDCWILDASGQSGWVAIKMHVKGHFFTGKHCGVISAGDPPKLGDCVHFVDFSHITGIIPG